MRHAMPLRSPNAFDRDFDAEVPLEDPAIAEPKPVYRDAEGNVIPEPVPQPVRREPAGVAVQEPSKIRQLGQALGGATRHEDSWARSPNVTGTGAIHVKSFHCKLTGDCLNLLDQQINEWLDAHPQYEVKFVTTNVGEWTGKTKDPALIVSVWV